MGTKHETIPTPKPAMRRPTTKRGVAVAATWKATPIEKTREPKIKPNLKSAKNSDLMILSANDITDGIRQKSAKKGTGRKDGNDQGSGGCRNSVPLRIVGRR